MSRRARHPLTSTIHHVINRGVDHQPVFRSDADRIDFGRAIDECHERFGMCLHAYCLMDNHFHLVVQSSPDTLSTSMHRLGTTFVRHANDRAGRDGPMFHDRFTALPVTTDSYLVNLVRYVHLNPMAMIAVDHPARYRWSSYRAYLGMRRPPRFLDVEPILGLFGGRVEHLVEFTEGSSADRCEPALTAADLQQLAAREIAIERLLNDAEHVPSVRAVMIVLLDHPDARVRQLAEANLDFVSDDARRAARSRARKRLNSEASWRSVVDRVAPASAPTRLGAGTAWPPGRCDELGPSPNVTCG